MVAALDHRSRCLLPLRRPQSGAVDLGRRSQRIQEGKRPRGVVSHASGGLGLMRAFSLASASPLPSSPALNSGFKHFNHLRLGPLH
jgi:hypothetical protein